MREHNIISYQRSHYGSTLWCAQWAFCSWPDAVQLHDRAMPFPQVEGNGYPIHSGGCIDRTSSWMWFGRCPALPYPGCLGFSPGGKVHLGLLGYHILVKKLVLFSAGPNSTFK